METHAAVPEATRLPFDLDFQMRLIRLLCEDCAFGAIVRPYLKPEYFEDESLAWAWAVAQSHADKYGDLPSLAVLRQYARSADPRFANLYYGMVQRIEQSPLSEEQFMRDAAVSFCKRNIFVATVQQSSREYNAGNVAKAYELFARASEDLEKATWTTPDATFLFDELYRRQVRRLADETDGETIPTGLHQLDKLLNGGLSKGELGCWIAYAKKGKSTLLLNHGVVATRSCMRNTAHFVFEGGRRQVEDRYDAAFMQEAYQEIKNGMSSDVYVQACEQYRMLQGKLFIQAMVDDWDHTIVDVTEALRTQKHVRGWEPDLVIIDYGDLLSGRDKGSYRSETAKQKAAFRDMKLFASRGYAVWTASQVQRPREGSEDTADWIYARQVADCYEKVRVCDFFGSLNQCKQERDACVMRLYAELYRDNAADLRFCVHCDFSRMLIESRPGVKSPVMPDLNASSSRIGGNSKSEPVQRPASEREAHQMPAFS